MTALAPAELADKLDKRLLRDRRGNYDWEMGFAVDTDLYEEVQKAVAFIRQAASVERTDQHEAVRLLMLWSELPGAEDMKPGHDTFAFLGKENSAGWVWAREIRQERDHDAEMDRVRKMAIDAITQAEVERAEVAELNHDTVLKILIEEIDALHPCDGPPRFGNAVARLVALASPPRSEGVRASEVQSEDLDPADIWEAYCEEVPTKQRSPQGAMAFAIDRLFGGAAQASLDPLRTLAGLFSESVHETWTMGEVVSVIEDAIRMGSSPSSASSPARKERDPQTAFNLGFRAAGGGCPLPPSVEALFQSWLRDGASRAGREREEEIPATPSVPSASRGTEASPAQGPKQHGWPVGTRICDCVTGEVDPQPCHCELAKGK